MRPATLSMLYSMTSAPIRRGSVPRNGVPHALSLTYGTPCSAASSPILLNSCGAPSRFFSPQPYPGVS